MMIRKICFMSALILVVMTSTVFAMLPDTMDVQTAMNRSYETLLINSIDGTKYNVFLISDNAKYVQQFTAFKPLAHRPEPMLARP